MKLRVLLTGAVIILVAALLVFWLSSSRESGGGSAQPSGEPPHSIPSDNPSGEIAANARDLKDTPARIRQKFLDRISQASRPRVNPTALIELVRELELAGLLNDEEVRRTYQSVIGAFPAEDLATLAIAWPSDSKNTPLGDEFGEIAGVLRERNDPAQLSAFLGALPSDHPYRGEMIYKIAQRMGQFTPEGISSAISQLSESDKKAVANALVARTRNSSPNKGKKVELLRNYLEATQDPALAGPLLKLHIELTAKDDPLATLQWVKSQSKEIAEQMDELVMRSLIANHPEQAFEYLDEFRQQGNKQRHQRAMECLVNEYSKANPAEALNWVLEMPADVAVSGQMVADPFVRLKEQDPEKAKAMMEGAANPEWKKLMFLLWKTSDEKN